MSNDPEITNLEQLLDRIDEAAKEVDRVSLETIMEAVGKRSFGPLLLVAGLITVSPGVGDIPGVPTIMAIFVLLIAAQLLFHRKNLWLPRWLLKRSVAQKTLCKTLDWMRRPSRFIDRGLRPRLLMFTHASAVAVACIIIAAALPAMEVIPFSANVAGAALTAFGLALVAHDGLLGLVGFAATVATLGLSIYHLV